MTMETETSSLYDAISQPGGLTRAMRYAAAFAALSADFEELSVELESVPASERDTVPSPSARTLPSPGLR